jgi:hypothetical protein
MQMQRRDPTRRNRWLWNTHALLQIVLRWQLTRKNCDGVNFTRSARFSRAENHEILIKLGFLIEK